MVLYDRRLRSGLTATEKAAELEKTPSRIRQARCRFGNLKSANFNPRISFAIPRESLRCLWAAQCFLTSNRALVAGVAMCRATGGFH
jgi:hypothetical protein